MGHGDELKTFLTKSKINIDIICIQETWLYNQVKKSRLATTFEITGYTSLYTTCVKLKARGPHQARE